jgi:FAD/FMN-containing dehydrogenase/ferredoxin
MFAEQKRTGTVMAGLEHLDDRYLRAVGYSTKSKRGGFPKMVLIGDIAGDNADDVAKATSEIVRIANSRSGEGFIAISPEARKKFWLDRKKTAAISRHTNAFKVNEDVVIPLPRMAEYTDGIERINIELSLRNKLKLCREIEAFLERGNLPLGKQDDANDIPSAELLEDRVAQALAVVREVRDQWQGWLTDVDSLFPQLQEHSLRASWKTQIRPAFQNIFSGSAFLPILNEVIAIHQRVLKGRVWVALHMHAGDGNVHTNIPVNSDNYEMLQTAHEAVARIMVLARSLDGVISGEHGIGITKLEFLTDAELANFTAYKAKVDPEGRFNKGKLLRGAALTGLGDDVHAADLTHAYTPSFGLMGHESLIMQQSDIGEIAASVKDCLRCGKCKPVCATHVPRANLLYSPRNKILATSLLVEAFLYEEQTRRGISIKHWQEFEDVADHCTVCHKCLTPCPVNIDFGEVSMNMSGPHGHGGCGHEGAAFCGRFAQERGPQANQRTARFCGHRAHQRAGDPLHQQEDAGQLAQKNGAGFAGHRRQRLRPHHPQPESHHVGIRSGVLLPRLRLGEIVQSGGIGHPGHALACGRADGAAPGLLVLRLPAKGLGPVRQGRENHHRQPGAVPPRGQHAQLLGHQDRGGELRHLLRPAAWLPV